MSDHPKRMEGHAGAVHRFRGIFSRIALVAAPAVRAGEATADALFARVSALRGDVR